MRLSAIQQDLIVRAVRDVAGSQARVRLFGSRIDDAARGGDIDLLVESPEPLASRLEVELRLGARLERLLGGRRVDLLVVDPNTALLPVHEVAKATGIEL